MTKLDERLSYLDLPQIPQKAQDSLMKIRASGGSLRGWLATFEKWEEVKSRREAITNNIDNFEKLVNRWCDSKMTDFESKKLLDVYIKFPGFYRILRQDGKVEWICKKFECLAYEYLDEPSGHYGKTYPRITEFRAEVMR